VKTKGRTEVTSECLGTALLFVYAVR